MDAAMVLRDLARAAWAEVDEDVGGVGEVEMLEVDEVEDDGKLELLLREVENARWQERWDERLVGMPRTSPADVRRLQRELCEVLAAFESCVAACVKEVVVAEDGVARVGDLVLVAGVEEQGGQLLDMVQEVFDVVTRPGFEGPFVALPLFCLASYGGRRVVALAAGALEVEYEVEAMVRLLGGKGVAGRRIDGRPWRDVMWSQFGPSLETLRCPSVPRLTLPAKLWACAGDVDRALFTAVLAASGEERVDRLRERGVSERCLGLCGGAFAREMLVRALAECVERAWRERKGGLVAVAVSYMRASDQWWELASPVMKGLFGVEVERVEVDVVNVAMRVFERCGVVFQRRRVERDVLYRLLEGVEDGDIDGRPLEEQLLEVLEGDVVVLDDRFSVRTRCRVVECEVLGGLAEALARAEREVELHERLGGALELARLRVVQLHEAWQHELADEELKARLEEVAKKAAGALLESEDGVVQLGVAQLLSSTGELRAAAKLYLAAADKFGLESGERARALAGAGVCLGKLHQLDDAETAIRQAHAVRVKLFGKESFQVAESLNDIGWVYEQRGEVGRALAAYQQALAVKREVLGSEHPSLSVALNNMANVLRRGSEGVELVRGSEGVELVRAYYEEALRISEAAMGGEHPSTATSLVNLGSLLMETGEHERGLALLKRALVVQENVLGATHPATATTLSMLAVFYWKNGDEAAAKAFGVRSVETLRKHLGLAHPTTQQVVQLLAEIGVNVGVSRDRQCAACGSAGPHVRQRCSRCKKVWYCARACQRRHWRTHKVLCFTV